MTDPKNDFEAAVLALKLAITAPDEQKAQDAIEIAESLIQSLSEFEIKRAKQLAVEQANASKPFAACAISPGFGWDNRGNPLTSYTEEK